MALPKKLTLGKFVVGPDFHGCINTGLAPAILKSRVLHNHPELSRGFRFAVGPQIYVEIAISKLVAGQIPENQAYYQPNPRNGEDTRRYRVRVFKTYSSAKKYFETLVAAAEQVNAELRAKECELRKRAAKGDIGAALDLIDY